MVYLLHYLRLMGKRFFVVYNATGMTKCRIEYFGDKREFLIFVQLIKELGYNILGTGQG